MRKTWTRREFVRLGAAAAAAAGLSKARPCLASTGINIVSNGVSRHTIVRRAQGSPCEVYAAQELQKWIAETTGAYISIVDDKGPLPSQAILVGNTRHTTPVLGETYDPSNLGDDGFRLVSRSPHFLILGSATRGTLYGVYEFLEKYVGCRWYASFCKLVPHISVLPLPIVDDLQLPTFAWRESFWFDMFDGDLAARNKVNGAAMRLEARHGGKFKFGGPGVVHTAYLLVPPSKYFESHPEYFAEVAGKRLGSGAQICWTNPNVVSIIIDVIESAIRAEPDATLFSVSPNDCGGQCECAACSAIDSREGTPAASLLWCANRVAETITKRFPKVFLEILAYKRTRRPPSAMNAHPNVIPRLCSIECDFSKPIGVSQYPQNEQFLKDLKRWSAMSQRLFIWDYVTNFEHYLAPFPNFRALQGNLQLFRDNHVFGVFAQGASRGPHAEFAELRAWVLAKLMWNPNANTESLLDDFFTGYFGAAARPVRTYFNELHDLVRSPEQQLFAFSPMTAPFFNDQFFERALHLFHKAERLVADDTDTLYRVKLAAVPVLYARFERSRTGTVQQRQVEGEILTESIFRANTAKLADELLKRLDEVGDVCISEDINRHNSTMAALRHHTLRIPLSRLSQGNAEARVTGKHGAAAYSLRKNKVEYFNPTLGGLDMRLCRGVYDERDDGIWTESITATDATYSQGSSHTRRFAITPRGLTLSSVLPFDQFAGTDSAAVLRLATTLGEGEAIAVKRNSEPWRLHRVPSTSVISTLSLKGSSSLALADPISGRGLRLHFGEVFPERFVLVCNSACRGTSIYAASGAPDLATHASLSYHVEIELGEVASDAPRIRGRRRHTSDIVSIEDCFLPLGRPGIWGARMRDADSDDGFAIQLFNTHCEWCLHWPVQPTLFEPKAKYRASVLVRVLTSDSVGRAFGAGIYDLTRGEIRAQMAPGANTNLDGYQWYDIGEWIPEANQYIWVHPPGPQRSNGGNPAVAAVFVKRLQFHRIS